MEAIEGDDADEFGERIFDLTEKGCNLRIKVEEQGGFPTYVSSRFASPSVIPGIHSDNVGTIYDQVFDLDNVFPVKTYEELETMLNEHYFGTTSTSTNEPELPTNTNNNIDDDDDDDITFDDDDTSGSIDDAKVKDLLDTLD